MPASESSSRPKPKFLIRPATEDDLEGITQVTVAGFPADPQWYYRLPYWREYLEDHYKYSKERLGGYYSQVFRACATYIVAEVEEEMGKKVVAYTLWQLPGTHLEGGENEMKYPPPQPDRRDMNHKRHAAYFDAIHDGKTNWFDKRFGERQLYIAILCADPAYQGCGIGTALLQKAIDKARDERVGITLMASPGGRKLYSKMGFKDGGWTKAQVEGEEEFVEFPGMYWVVDEDDFPITAP